MPPPYSKDGYTPVPQNIAPGTQLQQPVPIQGYAPAPPVLQHQQSSNTVCHDDKYFADCFVSVTDIVIPEPQS